MRKRKKDALERWMDQEEGLARQGLQNRLHSEGLMYNRGGQLQASTIPTFVQ